MRGRFGADHLDATRRERARDETAQSCVGFAVDHVHRAPTPFVERTVRHPEPLERAEAELGEARVRRDQFEVVGREEDRLAGCSDRGAMCCARGAPLGIRVLPELGVSEVDGARAAHAAKYGR